MRRAVVWCLIQRPTRVGKYEKKKKKKKKKSFFSSPPKTLAHSKKHWTNNAWDRIIVNRLVGGFKAKV
jgi:hypothetical protein